MHHQHYSSGSSRQPGRGWQQGGATWKALATQCHALRSKAAAMLASGHGRYLALGMSTVSMAAAASAPLQGPNSDSASGSNGQPQGRPRSWQDFGHEKRRATDTFLILNCAAFALQWLSQDLLTFWGAKVNALIAAGQWWRLFSPAFLHSGAFHLLVNCHALHSIGPHLELVSGSARMAAVYVTSAFTGTLVSYLLTPSPSIGASGALFGCGAALAVFYWRHKDVLQQHSDSMLRNLGITVAINLGYSLLAKNVDNWGHLGGALGGAVFAYIFGPYLVRAVDGRYVDRPLLRWLAYKDPPARSQAPVSVGAAAGGSVAVAASGAAGGVAGTGSVRRRHYRRRSTAGSEGCKASSGGGGEEEGDHARGKGLLDLDAGNKGLLGWHGGSHSGLLSSRWGSGAGRHPDRACHKSDSHQPADLEAQLRLETDRPFLKPSHSRHEREEGWLWKWRRPYLRSLPSD